MKKNTKIQKTRIDKSVLILFLSSILISATVFAYKFANYEPCSIVTFKIAAKNYRVGEIIRFKDYSKNVEKRTWYFGDSTQVDIEVNPFHVYKKPGEYTIKLLVNGKCESEQLVTIKEKAFVLDSTKLASFEVPKFIKVGEVLKVKDQSPNATQWEWRFGETADVNSTLQNPTYVYKTPGIKTITLVTNGDPKYASHIKIQVLKGKKNISLPLTKNLVKDRNKRQNSNLKYTPKDELPEAPNGLSGIPETPQKTAPAPTKKSISKAGFEKMLLNVSEKNATARDFDAYLCGNLSIPAIVKNKKTTFRELCQKITGKKITIKNLQLFKNKQSGCIEYIKLDYKKNGLF